MDNEHPESDVESQRRFEELSAQVTANRADIDALQAQAAEAHRQAEASEARADRANHRADASEARAAEDRHRIDDLEAGANVDREMITELQAEGLLSTEHAAHLEEALTSSRRIGAAIGIVMARRNVTEQVAFEILKTGSQNSNRKVRVPADDVVSTGDISDLPNV